MTHNVFFRLGHHSLSNQEGQRTKEKCTIDVYIIVGFSWEQVHET
jgi:hypothetical protein